MRLLSFPNKIITFDNLKSRKIFKIVEIKNKKAVYNWKVGNYSKTLTNEYIERINQMSYSLLSDNGMLQIYSFLIKGLYETL